MADATIYTDSTPNTVAPATVTLKGGMKFHVNQAGWSFKSSTVVSTTTSPTKAYLTDSSQNVLASASFSGLTATFSPAYALTNGADYFILHDKEGASYVRKYISVSGYPYAHTEINWTAGKDESSGTVGTGEIFTIDYVVLTPSSTNITVTPATLTISTDEPVKNIRITAKPLSLTNSLTLSAATIIGSNISYNADGSITYPLRPQTHGMAGIRTDFPIVSGLQGGYNKQAGRISNLRYTKSYVDSRYNAGL